MCFMELLESSGSFPFIRHVGVLAKSLNTAGYSGSVSTSRILQSIIRGSRMAGFPNHKMLLDKRFIVKYGAEKKNLITAAVTQGQNVSMKQG